MEIRINTQPRKHRHLLKAEDILRYLIANDEKVDTHIMCKPNNIDLITTDYSLYEAMGSIKPYDEFKLNKLTKLLEVVDITTYRHANRKEKPILKDERVEELRKLALKQ